MKSYKYMLFDWDGTIAMTLNIWRDALSEVLKKRGYELEEHEVGANYEIFKQRFRELGHGNADGLIMEALTLSNRNIPEVALYPDAIEVLRSLKQNGTHLALVTTSMHEQIDPLLIKNDIQDIFDVVVCGDDTEQSKPSPEPIIKALEMLNAPASQAVMVGDSSADLLAAANANVDSILFYPAGQNDFYQINELLAHNPTYVINSFLDLTNGIITT